MSVRMEEENFYGFTSLNQTNYEIAEVFRQKLPITIILGLSQVLAFAELSHIFPVDAILSSPIEKLGKSLFTRMQNQSEKIFSYGNRSVSYEKCPHGPADLSSGHECPFDLVEANEKVRREDFFEGGECKRGWFDLVRLNKLEFSSDKCKLLGKVCHRSGKEVELAIEASPKKSLVNSA